MFVLRTTSLWLASAACIVGLAGCPVDERRLASASADGGQSGSPTLVPTAGRPTGEAGADAGSNTPSGGSSATGNGGAAGDENQPPITVEGCADLDGDGTSDCTETKATNPEFETDVAGWAADAQNGDSFVTTLSWDPSNAWGSDASGSAKVSVSGTVDFNGASLRAATQCLLVPPGQLVVVYANVLVDAGQDPAGTAEIDVSFFDTVGCTGAATSSFSTPPPQDASPGSWLTVHAGLVSGAATKSALIKLGVVKPFRTESLSARFDNILVKVQSS